MVKENMKIIDEEVWVKASLFESFLLEQALHYSEENLYEEADTTYELLSKFRRGKINFQVSQIKS